jgi:hypothetical protein
MKRLAVLGLLVLPPHRVGGRRAPGIGGDGEGYAGRCDIDDGAELEGAGLAR